MASNKKTTLTRKSAPAPAIKSRSTSRSKTPVRNSAVPKAQPAAGRANAQPITHEAVAKRAYEIWLSGTGGSEADNWLRAERELRAGR